MRTLARWSLVLLVLSSGTVAHAQASDMAGVRDALDRLDVVACLDQAGLTAGEVRVAVVVYPDGVWSVALGPIGTTVAHTEAQDASLDRCVRVALSGMIDAPIARAPRRASVVVRTAVILGGAERELDARLRGGEEQIARCVFTGPGALRARVAARVHIERAEDGTARVTGGRGPVARCVAGVLGALPVGTPDVDRVVTVSPPPPAPPPAVPDAEPRPDGREGAICIWGQRRADALTLPEPRACRSGLRCCSAGGAAGSDAICMRVDGPCPAYP